MDALTTPYTGSVPAATTQTERVITLLTWTYGLVPIVAGADKFVYLLTDWNKYLAPAVTDNLPLSPDTFMGMVGVVEIVAGIIVLTKPKAGSMLVAIWLLAIAFNLLLTGSYYDVAVRDVVLAVGAFALFLLVKEKESVQ